MRKGNLIKMAAPAILSAAMMVSGLPVMAADFTSDTAVETEAQTDEFDAADDTADAFAGDEETPFVDDQAAAEDEFAATAETGYKYVYAGLTWAQYWASEGVYNAANTASNGTFIFKARTNGTGSGLKDQVLQTASNVTATVKEASGSYGEFLRVDITGDGYGALGAKMYAVKWDYYGNGDKVLASYGTKFAADNWMHKAMGIQLGLTDSYRCQLPKGTDGTGKWKITVYAMGYADTVFEVHATDANIVKPEAGEADTTALKAAVEKAEALKEADYTADSWKAMQLELQEAKDLLAKEKPTQAEVDEATTHLNAAVEALVKADTKVTVTLNKKTATVYKGKTTTLKATVTGADAPKVTFTSSNPKVAAVNKTTGKVTAKAKGSAVITVKCGDVKVTCKVTVKNPTLTLNKTSASVKVGKTTKITAKATPSGKVTYKSGNKKIATVSSNGTIKGIKKGTAKITVTCNGVTKTVKVTVK